MSRSHLRQTIPDRASAGASRCSVLRTVSIVGDFWTLGILRCAMFGMRRFGQFEGELGVATNVLTDRLARLVEAGLLERTTYRTNPVRFEYSLTPAGRDLVPALLALKTWGDRHLQPDGPWTSLRHRGCQNSLAVQPICPDCGDVLTLDDIETVMVRDIDDHHLHRGDKP